MSASLDVDWGGTGSEAVDAESFTTLTPTLFLGKGFGFLPDSMRLFKPLAVTAQLGYAVPTRSSTGTIDEESGLLDTRPIRVPSSGAARCNTACPTSNRRCAISACRNSSTASSRSSSGTSPREVANFDGEERTTGTINPGRDLRGRQIPVGHRGDHPSQSGKRRRCRRDRAGASLPRRPIPATRSASRYSAGRMQRRAYHDAALHHRVFLMTCSAARQRPLRLTPCSTMQARRSAAPSPALPVRSRSISPRASNPNSAVARCTMPPAPASTTGERQRQGHASQRRGAAAGELQRPVARAFGRYTQDARELQLHRRKISIWPGRLRASRPLTTRRKRYAPIRFYAARARRNAAHPQCALSRGVKGRIHLGRERLVARTPAGAALSAGYLTIKNDSGASRPADGGERHNRGADEIHQMSMEGGVMKMRRLPDGLPVPAKGSVTLDPNGYPPMFMQLKSPLTGGRFQRELDLRARGHRGRDVPCPGHRHHVAESIRARSLSWLTTKWRSRYARRLRGERAVELRRDALFEHAACRRSRGGSRLRRAEPDRGAVPALVWRSLRAAFLASAAWLGLERARSPMPTGRRRRALPVVLFAPRFSQVLLAGAALPRAAALRSARLGAPSARLALLLEAVVAMPLPWRMDRARCSSAGAASSRRACSPSSLFIVVREAPLDVAAFAARRFSTLGLIAVLTLAATALFQGWVLGGGLAGLTGTAYGGVLLTKTVLFAPMIALAACNRFRLAPALVGGQGAAQDACSCALSLWKRHLAWASSWPPGS